jgi:hypothetical protein
MAILFHTEKTGVRHQVSYAPVSDNRGMTDREAMERWVQAWKEAGPELEAIRRREVREADNVKVIAALEDAFDYAVRALPPRPSSGLVEMQAWFAKLRHE